jgi:hypothetical protein
VRPSATVQARRGERRVCLVEFPEAKQRECQLERRALMGGIGQALLQQLIACDGCCTGEIGRFGMERGRLRPEETGKVILSTNAQSLVNGSEGHAPFPKLQEGIDPQRVRPQTHVGVTDVAGDFDALRCGSCCRPQV